MSELFDEEALMETLEAIDKMRIADEPRRVDLSHLIFEEDFWDTDEFDWADDDYEG